MKKAIVISAMVMTALSHTSSVEAKNASTEENVGVASGALVGAAAGGPVGFIIGAAIGGLVGSEVEKADQVDGLKHQLSEASTKQSRLQQEVNSLKQQVAMSETSKTLDGSEMLQMDLLFHTNATGLDDVDHKRIEQLASFLKRYPSLAVQLDGFADPRGKQQKNQALSEQRIETVKQQLIHHGINEERIIARAFGESRSVATRGDLDAYALERRVSISFHPQQDQSFASNQ